MSNRELQHEIEQFLYREARLLDDRLFDDWLELFTDHVKYWMPPRDTTVEREDSTRRLGETSLFEDDKRFPVLRVRRFDTGLAHAEQPPSRTRHFDMNLELLEDAGDEIEVHSNILVFQSRLEKTENFFVF